MKSHLLDHMLCFLSMLCNWRYFGLNFGCFNSFHYWAREGLGLEDLCERY